MKRHRFEFQELFHVKHGYAFKSRFFDSSGPYVLLTPGNFNEEGGFRDLGGKQRYYTGDVPNGYVLDQGDLLVAMTEQAEGLLGSSALIPESGKYLHNQRLGLIVNLDERLLDKHYLYYLFNTREVRHQISASASGTKVRHTAPERIGKVEVELPLLVVQKKVARTLFAYDDLIENNRRRIVLLEEAARQLYREWFFRLRFPGHEHTPITNRVPDGWERKPLFDLASPTYGHPFQSSLFTEDGEGLPVVRIRDVLSGESKTLTREEAPLDRRLSNGDLLIGMDGDFHMGLWTGGDAWLNQRVVRIRTKGLVDDYLLFCMLRDPIRALNETITGTTVVHLGAKELKEIRLLLPPRALLARASELFAPLRQQILWLKLQNRQLRAARDLLLSRLMSGEIAV